ncbi:CUB domain-containing protein 1a [Odontesthes bonariensis]|uniref:CUB domain-containing protein 1a n=1 Tax=Odontesthes bonariensis TaxID=219752 RepID=UPI003F580A38
MTSYISGAVSLQILLLIAVISHVSGVLKLTVTPERGTTLIISSTQAKDCQVCTGSGRSRQCAASLSLKDNKRVPLEFECSKPQDAFRVEIVLNIECTTKSCSGHIIQADAGSQPLQDFPRRFTWNIKAAASKAFKLDFTETGLRQIKSSERCPDKHTYSLRASQTTGNIVVGKYCRGGTIRSAQILNQGGLSLDVPAGQKLQHGQFDVSVGEDIKSLARISLTLPGGNPSSSELLSPNYPDSFPDDDVMEWYFQVPDKFKADVRFLNVTQPQCLKKETAVEYHSKERGALVQSLDNPQPKQVQGSFLLTLRNCEMDRRRAHSPGLSLNFEVSASRTSSPVLCNVDLSKTEGLSLHVDNVRPDSDCEMKMNSETMEHVTVVSKGELSFQDCFPGDVQVTATMVIECSHLKDCPKTPVELLVPLLPPCLPAPLSRVTWTLRPAEDGTVKLVSPTGPLKQALPGQPCNDSILIKMDEEHGPTIGLFCPKGAIQNVLVHNNMSVTWRSSMGREALRTYFKHVLTATFETEIRERYIFTVSPSRDTPVLVATPGWPVGMKSLSTVSWMVSVPPKMEAHLMFANLSQPKCNNGHTNIRVQRVGSPEEDYSRREDEEAESELTVSESFYLNMSNCVPEKGDFGVIIKITLQERTNVLLMIILSVVAALLVIFAIVLVVVCMVIRKKKKQLSHEVSIYNPAGTNFLPGQNGFPKTREDNESHVYDTIEDTLVYTHLLKKGAEIGINGELDTYQSFAGHTDSQKPLASKDSSVNDKEAHQPYRFSSQGPPLPNRPLSHNQPMVSNEIYQTENQSEEESFPKLGPRLEPEGGN